VKIIDVYYGILFNTQH